MELCQQPYRLQPLLHGLSHGLKSVHRTLFTPVCGLVPPFRVPPCAERKINKRDTLRVSLLFIWYTGRDSNPQPSEPESDALSIEPPVHLS